MIPLAFLWNNRVKLVFCFLLLCIPIAYGIGVWDGRSSMEDQIVLDGLKETVNVQTEANKVRNHRPDDDQLVDILRSNRF